MTDPAATELSADVSCHQCGYNLRGLRPDGRCPECGGSIEEAIRQGRQLSLDASSARWLRLGVDGLSLAAVWPLIVLLFVLMGYERRWPFAAVSLLLVAAGSSWVITMPMSRGEWNPRLKIFRWAIRGIAIGLVALFVPLLRPEWQKAFVGPALALLAVITVLLFRYLAVISRDLKTRELTELAGFASWVVPIVFAVPGIALLVEYAWPVTSPLTSIAFAFTMFYLAPAPIVALVTLHEARCVIGAQRRPLL